jgi:hypothetical protein
MKFYRNISSTDSYLVGTLGVGEGEKIFLIEEFNSQKFQKIQAGTIIITSFHGITKQLSFPPIGAIYLSACSISSLI